MNFIKSAIAYADLIKLGHTLFALPFVLSAICLAYLCDYELSMVKISLIILAFVAARSSAMGFNRVVDVDIDAKNPRTTNRPTVTGKISIFDAKLFTILSIILFFVFAYFINWLCFILAFPALIVLLGYSYAKRFTFAAHYILGLALSLAPTGAWIAITDSIDLRILFLSFSLFFSIAGFDLIYALQDMNFDKKENLHSIPSRFGRNITLSVSAISFLVATLFLVLTGEAFELNLFYYLCVGVIFALYIFGEFSILFFGEAKTQLVFFYENVSISFLILIAIASNLI